ncbi:Alpha/Beta hydrolase protein, partial [Mycena vitilis]
MPSLTLKSGVVFFYTDSGAVPSCSDYKTLVIIHGHTFHSGTFKRLTPFAQPNSLRIISVNRREYPGSSPYSAQELSAFVEGDDAERASFLEQQGRDLAMFLDGLIDELSIPKTGGIALAGWSLGTLFLLSLIASVETLPAAVKERLCDFVHTVVLLQCPSLALGLPTPSGWLIPHTDPTIPPEARGTAFAKWVSSYFLHGDLSTHNLDYLTYNNTDPFRLSTVETLKPEELFEMTDFAPADKYDNIIGLPPFAGAVFNQTRKALFDATVRRAWSGTQFWSIYGTAEPWPVIYGAWFLEDQSRAVNSPELSINCKVIDGSNHFLVWEDPAKAIDELKECFSVSFSCK